MLILKIAQNLGLRKDVESNLDVLAQILRQPVSYDIFLLHSQIMATTAEVFQRILASGVFVHLQQILYELPF